MASLPALGAGPVSFLDSNGLQHEIPLSAITFGPNNQVTLNTAYPSAAAGFIASLVTQGFLTPGAPPPPAPLFTITSSQAGSCGNSITVTFANPNPTTLAVDVFIAATQTYTGLTPTPPSPNPVPPIDIAAVLGTTSPTPGTTPGLALLSSGGTPSLPTVSSVPFKPQAGGAFVAVIPAAGGATAFELTASAFASPPPGATLSAAVSAVNATASTFTLAIAYVYQQLSVPLSTLTATGTPFVPLVSFTPVPNAPPRTPSAGAPLTGGADVVPAVAASVSLPGFTITAMQPGSFGNSIIVGFSDAVAGPPPSVDVAITSGQNYTGLTLGTLTQVVGTKAAGGSKPGPAFVSSTGSPTMPQETAVGEPVKFTGTGPLTAAIPSTTGGATAFTLESVANLPTGAQMSATVSNVTSTSFSLAISLTAQATNVELSDLTALNTAFGSLILFAPAPGGPTSNFSAPAGSSIALSGGADTTPAQKASATVSG